MQLAIPPKNTLYQVRPSRATSSSEFDLAYYAALKLVARIDDDLTQGIRHYRNKAGELLTTLDEVVRAILAGDLAGDDKEIALPPAA